MKKIITALLINVLVLVMLGIASADNGVLLPADEAFAIPVLH